MSQPDPAQALLAAVIAFYDGPGLVGDPGAGPMLESVRGNLSAATLLGSSPREIAASALLEGALPGSALGAAIARAAHLFRWRQNPNYNTGNMGAAFMAGYGYVEFAGPKEALFHASGSCCWVPACTTLRTRIPPRRSITR